MDAGNVLDSGNHEELLKKSETYKNFYDKQINKN
jgi:ABC-type multidrug transport system, ATPase and permease components